MSRTPPVLPPLDPVADLLGGDRPIVYRASLAHATGGVTSGVLLAQLWYWTNTPTAQERDGWFFLSMTEICEQTGLSRGEQETARRRLRDLGVLEEERRGVPARLWFRINKEGLGQLLRVYVGVKAQVEAEERQKAEEARLKAEEAKEPENGTGKRGKLPANHENAQVVQNARITQSELRGTQNARITHSGMRKSRILVCANPAIKNAQITHTSNLSLSSPNMSSGDADPINKKRDPKPPKETQESQAAGPKRGAGEALRRKMEELRGKDLSARGVTVAGLATEVESPATEDVRMSIQASLFGSEESSGPQPVESVSSHNRQLSEPRKGKKS